MNERSVLRYFIALSMLGCGVLIFQLSIAISTIPDFGLPEKAKQFIFASLFGPTFNISLVFAVYLPTWYGLYRVSHIRVPAIWDLWLRFFFLVAGADLSRHFILELASAKKINISQIPTFAGILHISLICVISLFIVWLFLWFPFEWLGKKIMKRIANISIRIKITAIIIGISTLFLVIPTAILFFAASTLKHIGPDTKNSVAIALQLDLAEEFVGYRAANFFRNNILKVPDRWNEKDHKPVDPDSPLETANKELAQEGKIGDNDNKVPFVATGNKKLVQVGSDLYMASWLAYSKDDDSIAAKGSLIDEKDHEELSQLYRKYNDFIRDDAFFEGHDFYRFQSSASENFQLRKKDIKNNNHDLPFIIHESSWVFVDIRPAKTKLLAYIRDLSQNKRFVIFGTNDDHRIIGRIISGKDQKNKPSSRFRGSMPGIIMTIAPIPWLKDVASGGPEKFLNTLFNFHMVSPSFYMNTSRPEAEYMKDLAGETDISHPQGEDKKNLAGETDISHPQGEDKKNLAGETDIFRLSVPGHEKRNDNFYITDFLKKRDNQESFERFSDSLKEIPRPQSNLRARRMVLSTENTDILVLADDIMTGEACVFTLSSQVLLSTLMSLPGIAMGLMLGMAMLATSAGLVLAGSLITPIINLSRKAKQISKGDLSVEIQVDSSDEIGVLQLAAREMVEKINDRMRLVNQELLEERDKFTILIDNSAEGIVLLDEKGKVSMINPQAARLIEIEGSLALCKDWQALRSSQQGARISNLDYSENARLGTEISSSKALISLSIEGQAPYRHIFETITSVNRQGNYCGSIVILRDITVEREVDRMKSEFVSSVSHELRTPLTSIMAFTEMILDGEAEDPETRNEYIEIVHSESERLSRLVNDILDLSKMESGRLQPKLSPVNLYEIASSVVTRMKAVGQKKDISVFLESDPVLENEKSLAESNLESKDKKVLPGSDIDQISDSAGEIGVFSSIEGDKELIEQAMINLISNGIKYNNKGGFVKISLGREKIRENSFVYIKVEDNGFGIPATELPQLFQKFFRVEKNKREEITGSGLGLVLVREIARLHGGDCTVNSEEGKGSAFKISIKA